MLINICTMFKSYLDDQYFGFFKVILYFNIFLCHFSFFPPNPPWAGEKAQLLKALFRLPAIHLIWRKEWKTIEHNTEEKNILNQIDNFYLAHAKQHDRFYILSKKYRMCSAWSHRASTIWRTIQCTYLTVNWMWKYSALIFFIGEANSH